MLMEGQMPLLPTMSTDSFFNLVESFPSTTPRSVAPKGSLVRSTALGQKECKDTVMELGVTSQLSISAFQHVSAILLLNVPGCL